MTFNDDRITQLNQIFLLVLTHAHGIANGDITGPLQCGP